MSDDIEFVEPEQVPRPRPEVRIESLSVRPYRDRRRVRAVVTLTPFLENPNLDILMLDPEGRTVAEMSIIEAYEPEIDVTVHLRDPEPRERYLARAELYYTDQPVQHTMETDMVMPPAESTTPEQPPTQGSEAL